MLIIFLLSCQPPEDAIQPNQHVVTLYTHQCDSIQSQHFRSEFLGTDWLRQPYSEDRHLSGWGLAVEDFNQDGLWDVFLPHPFHQDQLFLGKEDGTLENHSVALTPNDPNALGFGATAIDLDFDGDVDIAVGAEGYNYLYENDNGQFMLIPEAAFSDQAPSNFTTWHLAIADANQDGWWDFYGPTFYTRFLSENDDLQPNLIYWGTSLWQWNRQLNWSEHFEYSPANAGGWLDANDDGILDVFVVNDKPQLGFQSGLLLHDGDGHFEEWNDRGLNFEVHGMGLAWGDVNLDGLVDIVVTGHGEIALGMNEGNLYWYEASQSLGLIPDREHQVGWGVELVDLDNDGDQDLLIANGPEFDRNGDLGGDPANDYDGNIPEQLFAVYLNHNGHFELQLDNYWQIGEPGVHRGFTLVDYNQDGYLDIFARNLGRGTNYWQSNCLPNKSIMIRLKDNVQSQNPTGIGTRIWVSHPQLPTQFRDIQVGSSNIASSSPPIAHFGVGMYESVDIKIRWPDGTITEHVGIATGQTIEISRE